MSCIFLLMHMRLAAIVVAITIIGPFSIFLVSTGSAVECAVALNLVVVTTAMLYVAVCFSFDFERMVTNAADLHRLSEQNARLAASDSLTSLPNRRQFFQALEQAGREAAFFSVIVVDLDGFKTINDVYGHDAGDRVLREIGARLQRLAPDDSCMARLGGDEFACLLAGPAAATAEALAGALIASCRTPVVCPSFTASVGASAGVSRSQSTPGDPMVLYERADYALFEAKRAGRGRVESFTAEHALTVQKASKIAQLLRAVDLRDELSTIYQPIYCAHTGVITSFEALVRWHSRELGPIAPSDFIPIAERTDLILQISCHVLRIALSDAAAWPAQVSLKVNLSVRDLMSRAQTEALIAVLRNSAIHPRRVTFEVTETIFAESLDEVRRNIDVLRSSGCAVAIDDFGVGYSSLNYIHALSPDLIKIDRCFVTSVATDETTQRIVRTIVELARNVGARTVAEGVETAAQAHRLAELGCDELQGYFLSKPVTPEVAARLAWHSAAPAEGRSALA